MTDSAQELPPVLLAQSGGREALESLLRRVQPDLFRYICGVVGRSTAEDVLQEVLLQICRDLKWLRDPELFRPWAYRIASRASFKHLQRERRWSKPEGEDAEIEELPAHPERTTELFSDLAEVLDRTSPASRAVLLLHYVEDLPIELCHRRCRIERSVTPSGVANSSNQPKQMLMNERVSWESQTRKWRRFPTSISAREIPPGVRALLPSKIHGKE